MRKFALTAIAAAFAVTAFTGGTAKAAGDAPVPAAQDWSWDGIYEIGRASCRERV